MVCLVINKLNTSTIITVWYRVGFCSVYYTSIYYQYKGGLTLHTDIFLAYINIGLCTLLEFIYIYFRRTQ